MQIAAEMCRALCYKLQMFGVAIDYLMSVMCDNQSVQKNCSIHTSLLGLLSKKHNPICYHKVCESVATGWTRVDWVKSENNLANIFTKVLEVQKCSHHNGHDHTRGALN